MNNNQELIQKMRAGRFVENNGNILYAINVLREKYVELSGVLYALPDIDEDDLRKAVNYFEEQGYIRVRDIQSKAVTSISDAPYQQLEAKLIGKGIQLLAGFVKDPAVKLR